MFPNDGERPGTRKKTEAIQLPMLHDGVSIVAARAKGDQKRHCRIPPAGVVRQKDQRGAGGAAVVPIGKVGKPAFQNRRKPPPRLPAEVRRNQPTVERTGLGFNHNADSIG
ncbi:MAG: hypothetical protein UZ07_CHB004001608 [Chlorobi bacterium OLB7]|nr:MAG: hypothetical protein UZ07_CHB004001608 [Chlorobi bacterium OLB7]